MPSSRATSAGRRPEGDVQARIGSLLFLGGAGATIVGLSLPHSSTVDEQGYLVLAAALVVMAGLMQVLPPSWRRFSSLITVTAAIIAVTFGHAMNGEGAGGAPALNELFFVWPMLYVGYFHGGRAIAFATAVAGTGYVLSCLHHGFPLEAITQRTAMVVSVLVGTAGAAWTLRRHVDRLVGRLDALARTDALTGLANRRAFDERLQDELDRHARTGEPFALLLADLDHFKHLNDREGHAAGDAALARIAAALRDRSRSIDTVARVGGEEFALILPGATLPDGIDTAERLRPSVAPLTMSVGVVEGGRDGLTADDLLRAADRALYAAKNGGRDAVVAARALAVV